MHAIYVDPVAPMAPAAATMSSRAAEATERKIITAVLKLLRVPKSLYYIALYCKKPKVALPLESATEEYKADKARLAIILSESVKQTVRKTLPDLKTE